MYTSNNIQHFFNDLVVEYSKKHNMQLKKALKLFEHHNIMYVMSNCPFVICNKHKDDIYAYIDNYIYNRTATTVANV